MELVTEKLLCFVLVLTRISAFFLVLPVFSWNSIPVRVKVAIIFFLAIFFSMFTKSPFAGKEVSAPAVILLAANEATYGLALGVIAEIIFSVVKFSAQIIERQMGFELVELLDPLTGEMARPLGSLLEMIFIILFLSANGHHLLLLMISKSYEAFPVGSMPTIEVLTGGVIRAGSILLVSGLRLAAPMLAAFLVLLVALAVLARMVPEMNILFVSLPLRIGLGLMMAAIFLPFVNGFVSEFADWMGKLLPL